MVEVADIAVAGPFVGGVFVGDGSIGGVVGSVVVVVGRVNVRSGVAPEDTGDVVVGSVG